MFDFILLMAGQGKRTQLDYNKVKYLINNKPLYQYSLDLALANRICQQVILVVNSNEYDEFCHYNNERIQVVIGGDTRSQSVLAGAKAAKSEIVLIHDAARPNIKSWEIEKVYEGALKYQACVLAVPVKDCIKESNQSFATKTLDRENLWQVQTPQGVNRKMLIAGMESDSSPYFDDVEVLERNYQISAHIINGRYQNIKVTSPSDLDYIKFLMEEPMNKKFRIGHSNDTHKLVKGRKLILGGIEIPFEKGLLGHSDADVVLHAISEAILGALGLGDLGMMFADTNSEYKDKASSYFLEVVYQKMIECGYVINNIDVIIYLEHPFMQPFKEKMKVNIARILRTPTSDINIKATRKEGLGFIGREEGIEAEAVVLLVSK